MLTEGNSRIRMLELFLGLDSMHWRNKERILGYGETMTGFVFITGTMECEIQSASPNNHVRGLTIMISKSYKLYSQYRPLMYVLMGQIVLASDAISDI